MASLSLLLPGKPRFLPMAVILTCLHCADGSHLDGPYPMKSPTACLFPSCHPYSHGRGTVRLARHNSHTHAYGHTVLRNTAADCAVDRPVQSVDWSVCLNSLPATAVGQMIRYNRLVMLSGAVDHFVQLVGIVVRAVGWCCRSVDHAD
jgi:hypothetical protein